MADRPVHFPARRPDRARHPRRLRARGRREPGRRRVGDEKVTVADVAAYMQRANYGANVGDVERAVNEVIDAHLALDRARERYTPPRSRACRWKSGERPCSSISSART